MRTRVTALLAISLSLFITVTLRAETEYSVNVVPMPTGWTLAHATAINDSGQITGQVYIPGVADSGRAFIGNSGGLTVLPLPTGCRSTSSVAINTSGQIVGDCVNGATTQPFIGTVAGLTTLALPAGWSWAISRGINDLGQVVGDYFDSRTGNTGSFIGTAAGLTAIPLSGGWVSSAAYGVNNVGQVIGSACNPTLFPVGPCRAVIFSDSRMTVIPLPTGLSAANAFGMAINDSGEVAGTIVDFGCTGCYVQRSFVGTAAGTVELSPYEATHVDINNAGQVIADFGLWDTEHGARDLNTVLPAGWKLEAFSINDQGQILARGRQGSDNDRDHLALLTPAISLPRVPSLVSLTPFQGQGTNVTLTAAYGHGGGWASLKTAELIVNPRWENATNSCYVQYSSSTNSLALVADNGIALAGTITPGEQSTASNSQCTLNGSSSTVVGSGNNLAVSVALTFKPAFTGQKHIWMRATDYSDVTTNWLVYGMWFPNVTAVSAVPWYRIFDPFAGSHLYTFDKNEYDTLGARGFTLEGPTGLVLNGPTTVTGVADMALYRIYVSSTKSHFWTSDRNEYLSLINQQKDYVGEGVASYVMPYINAFGQVSPRVTNSIPFYRMAERSENLHFWTTDLNEYNIRGAQNWIQEGIASYIFPITGAQLTSPAVAPLATTAPMQADPDHDDGAPVIVAVLSGASYQPGPVAPGQLLALYGRHLGGTVLVNGVAARVLSAADNEIRMIAPEALGDVSAIELLVDNGGRRSKVEHVKVACANPGVFAANHYGRGNAQSLNEDGSVNSPERPAARGSVVTLYATGVRGTGLPLTAHIGGFPAQVVAREQSGSRAGAVAIKLRVPENLEAAPFQPVILHVGNLSSQAGVGLAIR